MERGVALHPRQLDERMHARVHGWVGKSFGSDISVDGTADAWNMPIVGNFHQLQELEKKHPNLKVEVSLGGWTYSKYLSDVAATDASRKKFVSSCIDMFVKGNIPAQNGYGGAASRLGPYRASAHCRKTAKAAGSAASEMPSRSRAGSLSLRRSQAA